MAPCQLGLFAKSSASVVHADLGYNVLAFSRDSFQAEFDAFPGLTLIAYDLRPSSRGELRLSGPDTTCAPLIRANYLTTQRDQQVAVNGMRLTRRIMRQAALAPYAPQEMGVQNLQVIDVSVMPTLISGNTATPTLMIPEKGATIMLQNAPTNTHPI